MPELAAGPWALPGLGWLVLATVLAGLVRGFTGFGTGMVLLPVAAGVLGPFQALTVMVAIDFVGPLVNVRAAWREVDGRDLARLCAGLVVALPAGILVLTLVPAEAFRWAVSVLALALLGLLVAGVRYRGRLTPPLVVGTGLVSGFAGGAAGLAGPPAILLYLASTLPARVIRATLLLYLLASDIVLGGALAVAGRLEVGALVLGAALVLPYMAALWTGARLFDPARERLYRGVSYAIIAAAAISGLPVWD